MQHYIVLNNNSLVKTLLLFVIFLIPLLGASNAFGYEQIKVIFFIFSTSLAGFIWLLGKPELKWSLVKIVSLVFILILLVASILGMDLRQSFLGSDPYFQGWLIYAYLGLFSVLVASSKISVRDYASVLVLSGSLVSVCAIRQWVAIDFFQAPIPTYAGRVVSTFGQPNFYAGFLVLTLPFSYFLFKNENKKLRMLGWGSGIISLVGILVSFSRSTILLALMLLILGLIDQLKIKLRASLVVLGVVFISIFLALKFSSGIVGNEVSQPFQTRNPDLTRESVEKRVYIWPEAAKIAWQKPFLGYGLENIGSSFSRYFTENKHALFEENLNIQPVLISLKELSIDRSHNYFLDLLLFSGFPGLLAWLILVGVLFWKLKQNTKYTTIVGRNVLLVSLIVYVIWIQFQNQSIAHLIYFWLLVGLIDRARFI